MSLARNIPTPAAPIFLDAPKSYMRTLTEADASARWASWFDQPDVRVDPADMFDGMREPLLQLLEAADRIAEELGGDFDLDH